MTTNADTLTFDPKAFELPWETLDAIIEGKSPVDLNSVPIRQVQEAQQLIFNYGYDLQKSEDQQELQQLLAEACQFIEHRFLSSKTDWEALGESPGPQNTLPDYIKDCTSIETLLMMASKDKKPEKLWACAVLKVLHTLTHIHNNPTMRYFQEASDSIVSQFHQILRPQADGTFALQGDGSLKVDLYGFETKYKKPRESILIKLLCKKENVAEDVWDLVGVRLITHTPADALLAIEILREQKVLLFSNIVPSRSRNTLIDFEGFRTRFEAKIRQVAMGKVRFDTLAELMNAIPVSTPQDRDFSHNPSSMPDYRSIHITCRHFLRMEESVVVCDQHDETLCEIKKHRTRIAFPYEIQLADKASYLENKAGKTAHSLYKQKQLISARRRVLGRLLLPENRVR